MKKDFKKGKKVICIKQPDSIGCVKLKGKTGEITRINKTVISVDFGKKLLGIWYMLEDQIKLKKKKA